MKLKLQELQEEDVEAQKIRTKKRESWEEIDGVLHHQGLPYILKLIKTELISRHYDDLLAGQLGIKKTWELVARKYYEKTLRRDVENYVQKCDICLASKAMKYKPYKDL